MEKQDVIDRLKKKKEKLQESLEETDLLLEALDEQTTLS